MRAMITVIKENHMTRWIAAVLALVMLIIPQSLWCAGDWIMNQLGNKDLGVNWSSPTLVGPDHWMMTSDNGTIVVVTDTGRTITRMDVGICSKLNCLTVVGDDLVVGAEDGTMLLSYSGGATWEPIAAVGEGITAMAVINDNTLAVCTGKGMVYLVSLSSRTSTLVYNDPTARFMGMDMHRGELSVVGYKGTIIHSSDIGLTWQRTQHDSTIDFSCCHRPDDSTLVIGATLTRIYVTTDNGRTILNSYQPKTHADWIKGVEPVLSITHFGNSIFYTGVFPPRSPERYFNVYRSDDRRATWRGYEYQVSTIPALWVVRTAICRSMLVLRAGSASANGSISN